MNCLFLFNTNFQTNKVLKKKREKVYICDKLRNLSLEVTAQYTAPRANPINPPFAQLRSPDVDLKRSPVAVEAANVLSSSSSPRSHESVTPNPLYMTATTPRELAERAPCFIT